MRCESAFNRKERICIEEFTLFGKYRVISTLGSGNFSTVYLAEHLKLKIYRAVKRIPKHLTAKSSFSLEDSFLTEAELLKNLNHPGIPLIYDIDEDDDYIYMIEEFIQGESLDTYVSHQKNISQELIIKIGIQLCDILDYLHHLSPYPILYQDLKPEHIILCGNQIKLIDFGIASFFTGSEKHFQLFGTDGFVAPEALLGQPTSVTADIYGVGKILEFLINATDCKCQSRLLHVMHRATDLLPSRRYTSVQLLKTALLNVKNRPQAQPSHLIRNIAVLGCRSGAGSTHISISLTCTLQSMGIPSLYQIADDKDTLQDISCTNHNIQEREGIFYLGHFKGCPSYGNGISLPIPTTDCIVRDYGSGFVNPSCLTSADYIFFVLTGSDWDTADAISVCRQLMVFPQIKFICNHGNKDSAKRYAKLLKQPVYCFPNDSYPYRVSREKEQLFSKILKLKGGHNYFPF